MDAKAAFIIGSVFKRARRRATPWGQRGETRNKSYTWADPCESGLQCLWWELLFRPVENP